MEKYKFSVGDRVRVTKIDDMEYYGLATYEVGDVGTISMHRHGSNGVVYGIDFDELLASGEDGFWWAKESWLELENNKKWIICE